MYYNLEQFAGASWMRYTRSYILWILGVYISNNLRSLFIYFYVVYRTTLQQPDEERPKCNT